MEKAFGVLQALFAIVRLPAQFWRREDLYYIMKACIILHNMIVEDEWADASNVMELDESSQPTSLSNTCTNDFNAYVQRHRQLRDESIHYKLRNDLIEHIWQREGLLEQNE